MVQNTQQKENLPTELIQIVEDYFPNGFYLSHFIDYYAFTEPNMLALYQILLMSELLINCDESSRHKLAETLKNLVLSM